MRVALVGGSGFIGRWLVEALAGGERPVVVDCTRPPESLGGRVEFRKADLLDPAGLEPALDGVGAIVLLAARRPAAKAEPGDWELFAANVRMATGVLDACRRLGINAVVNISSMSVYGSRNRVPYREDERPLPESYYGAAKLAVEEVAGLLNRGAGMAIATLRLAHVVGVGEREDVMFSKFVARARKKERLEVYGSGTGRREYLYVKDAADAVRAALAKPGLRGTYNIGTGRSASHRELAEAVNHVFGNAGNLAFRDDLPEDRSEDGLDIRRAAEELGWRAAWTLERALEDIRDLPGG